MKRRSFLSGGTCATPYCGWVNGYFCVKCRHYLSDCACKANYGGCACGTNRYWAGAGERKEMRTRLALDMAVPS